MNQVDVHADNCKDIKPINEMVERCIYFTFYNTLTTFRVNLQATVAYCTSTVLPPTVSRMNQSNAMVACPEICVGFPR